MAQVWRTAMVRGWALLVLRMVVGFGFLMHGLAKLSRGPVGFGKLLAVLGVPFPLPTAWMVTLLEVSGGLALVIGLFVVLASVPLIGTMVVAIATIHGHNGFSSVNTVGLTPNGPVFGPPGYELNLLYIAALVAVALIGPGTLSVEGWLTERRRGRGGSMTFHATPAPPVPHLRVARPSRDLEAARRFYVDDLGLQVLGTFEDHAGFDGLIVGDPSAGYHLELTRHRDHPVAPRPTVEDLIVLYLPQRKAWLATAQRMLASGARRVRASNPYWELNGISFEDADGYRVVLACRAPNE